MHRSFPLRPPDQSSFLITYDNDAFEPQPQHTVEDPSVAYSCLSSSSSQSHLTLLDSEEDCNGDEIGADFRQLFGRHMRSYSLGRHRQSKLGSSYPVFAGGLAMQSPVSALSVYSFQEDGESTSFNFSEDAQPSSCSSSSCITSASLEGPHLAGVTGSHPSQIERSADDVSILKPFVIQASPLPCSDSPSVLSQTKSFRIMPSSSSSRPQSGSIQIGADSSVQSYRSLQGKDQRSVCGSPNRSFCDSSNSSCVGSNSTRSKKGFRIPRFHSPLRFFTACLLVGRAAEEKLQCEKKFHKESGSPQKKHSSPSSVKATLSSTKSPRKTLSNEHATNKLYQSSAHKIHQTGVFTAYPTSPRRKRVQMGDVSNGPSFDGKMRSSSMHSSSLKCTSSSSHDCVPRIEERSQSSSICFQEICHSTSSFREMADEDSFHYDSDSALFQGLKPRTKIYANQVQARSISFNRCASSRTLESSHEEMCDSNGYHALRREVKRLRKEKRDLALDLVSEIRARFSEREAAEWELKCIESEMESKVISVEKDSAYAQACLQRELESRKKEWAARLERIKVEETRLRQRVIHMAEDNVKLQKEISSFRARESSWKSQSKEYEVSLQAWMEKTRKSEEEIVELKQSFADVCNKLSDKQQDLDALAHQSRVLKMENTELLKEFSRLRRASVEQGITFEELWQTLVEFVNSPAEFKAQGISKLHRELVRLAVREQGLLNEISLLRTELADVKPDRPQSGDTETSALYQLSTSSSHNLNEDVSSNSQASEPETQDLVQDGMRRKLSHANNRVKDLEHQLEEREEEIKLLHLNLQKNDWEIKELHSELTWTRMERDGFRKQAEETKEESAKLTLELSELKKVAEKLDDELMLKEGQISILREAYSDGDF